MTKYLRNHDAPTLGQLGKLKGTRGNFRARESCEAQSKRVKEQWANMTPEQRKDRMRGIREGVAKARERRKQLGLG